MFDFFKDMGNYADRAVDRYQDGALLVDTAAVSDGRHPYETAVSHNEYNNGKWVIVEAYATKDEAKAGHDRWVAKMTAEALPNDLEDCCNSYIQQAIGVETFPRNPAP